MGVKKNPHPGKILAKELKKYFLSGNALALALRVPNSRITAILNGQRAMTVDTAARLERYFNDSPMAREWMMWQALYDLDKLPHAQIWKDVQPREDTGDGEDQ